MLEAGTRLNRADLRELGLAALRAEHEMRGDDSEIGWPDLRGLNVGDPDSPIVSVMVEDPSDKRTRRR